MVVPIFLSLKTLFDKTCINIVRMNTNVFLQNKHQNPI